MVQEANAQAKNVGLKALDQRLDSVVLAPETTAN